MNYKIKTLSASALIIASSFAFVSAAMAEPTNAPNRFIMCVHTPGKNDKCKDSMSTKKSAPTELKKEMNRLADLIVKSLADAKKLDPIKAKWNPPKEFLKCISQYSSGQKAPFDEFKNPTCWRNHVWDPHYLSFENWLYGWESMAILAKTFPEHIEPSALPTLLKAYDNIKSCKANNSCSLPK